MVLENGVEHFKCVLSWTAFHLFLKAILWSNSILSAYFITGLSVLFPTFLHFYLISPGAVWFSGVTVFQLPFGTGESALFLDLSAIYFS